MEIFIATSIKSFDLNPTHPGPLPRVSFHTSATQQVERSESKAARGRARSATDEVGDELQKIGEQRTRQILQAASNTLQGQRVAANFCAQETTSAEKRFMKQPQRLGDDFEFTFSCNAPPAWKFCAAQSQERFDRESAQKADQA